MISPVVAVRTSSSSFSSSGSRRCVPRCRVPRLRDGVVLEGSSLVRSSASRGGDGLEPSFAVSLKDTPPQDPSGGPASDDATTVVETVEMDLGAPDGSLTTQTIERDAKKQLVTLTVERPLGIVFEENAKGEVVAVEVLEGNGKSAGVEEGDMLRACSCIFEVKGKVDELAFYGNPPKTSYRPGIFTVKAGIGAFDRAISAIQSHAQAFDVDGGARVESPRVAIVLER